MNFYCTAWCTVPTLTHGSVFHLSQNCTDGQCAITTQAFFTCELEYHLTGFGYSRCVGNDEWDPPVPTCEGNYGNS